MGRDEGRGRGEECEKREDEWKEGEGERAFPEQGPRSGDCVRYHRGNNAGQQCVARTPAPGMSDCIPGTKTASRLFITTDAFLDAAFCE